MWHQFEDWPGWLGTRGDALNDMRRTAGHEEPDPSGHLASADGGGQEEEEERESAQRMATRDYRAVLERLLAHPAKLAHELGTPGWSAL